MPSIVRFKDPSNLSDKEVFNPITGITLAEFFEQNFTHNFGGLHTDVYINGERFLSTATDEAQEMNAKLDRQIEQFDNIVIINQPAEPITIAYVLIAALAIATVLLIPSVPGNADNQGSSPNSQLNAATNEFRPNQAIPEVFGSPVCYPDFIQPSYYYYENNLKILREIFCVSAGKFQINKVFSGETNIDEIPNSSWDYFYTGDFDGQYPPAPHTIPSDYLRITARETNEITNQVLQGTNAEVYEATVNDVTIEQAGATNNGLLTFTNDFTWVDEIGATVGGFLTVDLRQGSGGGATVILQGTYEVLSIDTGLNQIVLIDTGVILSTYIGCAGTIANTNSSGEEFNWIGWYTLSGSEIQECWFHVVMPTGIRTEKGGQATVTFRMEIRAVDEFGAPTGFTDFIDESITGATLDPQYRTYKFEALTAGRYQGRIRRTNGEYPGAASDRLVLEQLVGVEFQPAPNYGDVTLITVERKADERQIGGRESKINVEGMRMLPYFNRATGLIEPDNVKPTRDFADASMYTLCIAAKKDESSVDLATLYAINDALPANLRTFDFTFDDANVGLRERLSVICNVARVLAFRDYQSWTFSRVESKPIHTMLFNRRNTIGDAKQNFPKWLPSDKDSISLTYVTQPDNVEKTIYRSIENGVIVDVEGRYPEEITLVGCQSDAQATNRIEYEIRRLLYQRDSVEFDTYYFGLSAKVGDRVRWVDMNDEDVFGGEILDIFGDEYLTSEPIYFESGKTYYVQTTREDGSVGALVTCEPLGYTDKGFKSVSLSGAYTAQDGDYELGSKYLIAADDELSGTDYTLKSVSNGGDGIATVTLAEYNEILFEED